MKDITVTEYAARYEETTKDRLKRDDIYEGVLAMFDAKQAEIERLREALLNFACLCDESQCQDYGEDEGRIPCYRRQARAALGEGKE